MSRSASEWVAEVHGLAREKGWWGEAPDLSPTSVLAKLMLVLSEIAEAVELVRLSDFDPKATWFLIDGDKARRPFEGWRELGLNHMPKPEGFGTELADAVIRVMDLVGALGVDFARALPLFSFNGIDKAIFRCETADEILAKLMIASASFAAPALRMADGLVDPTRDPRLPEDLYVGVRQIARICGALGVDLEARIAEKHEYNKTRAWKHGNKRA